VVHHYLQQRGHRSARSLLQAGDGLSKRFPPGGHVRFELSVLRPTDDSLSRDANKTGRIFNINIAPREKSGLYGNTSLPEISAPDPSPIGAAFDEEVVQNAWTPLSLMDGFEYVTPAHCVRFIGPRVGVDLMFSSHRQGL
jgi:hypothetical protein